MTKAVQLLILQGLLSGDTRAVSEKDLQELKAIGEGFLRNDGRPTTEGILIMALCDGRFTPELDEPANTVMAEILMRAPIKVNSVEEREVLESFFLSRFLLDEFSEPVGIPPYGDDFAYWITWAYNVPDGP